MCNTCSIDDHHCSCTACSGQDHDHEHEVGGERRELLLMGVSAVLFAVGMLADAWLETFLPVWLVKSGNPTRKTAYDLVAVRKGDRLINMDAQAPNQVFAQWAGAGHFVPGLTLLKAEQKHGDSRFDFYWEAGDRKGFVEVKGVTLEADGGVFFPDAPTERGVKHLHGLTACLSEGYEAAVCFVIQMAAVDFFSPNDATHPAFGQALREAAAAGVRVLALECAVTPDSLEITNPVPVRL